MLFTYCGMDSTTVMPPALVELDQMWGGYIKSNLDFINSKGDEHLGGFKNIMAGFVGN
jgi:hypothetical protein